MERESSFSERSESTAKSSIQKFPDWIPGRGSAKIGGEDRQVLLIWYANPKSLSYDVLLSSFQFFPLNLVIQAWLELGTLGYICGEHQPALEVWGRYVRKRREKVL